MKPIAPEGSKVFVTHFRYTDKTAFDASLSGETILVPAKELRESKLSINAKGGMTEVFVTLSDGRETVAYAMCSEKDNFNRQIGRNIALGRALKNLDL